MSIDDGVSACFIFSGEGTTGLLGFLQVFEVLATAGDTHLGGEDFDNRVMDHFIKLYKSKTGTDISENQRALGKLKREVEKAKRTLSSQMSTKLEIESFEGGNDLSETLTRAKFEEINMDLFRKTLKPVEQVLKDAGVKKEDVDEVSFFFSFRPSLRVFESSSWSCDFDYFFLPLRSARVDRPCRWLYSYPQGSTAPQGILWQGALQGYQPR